MCWRQLPIYQKQCHHHGSSNHRDMHSVSCHRLQISSFDACWDHHPMEGEAVQKQHLMGNKCPLHIGHDEVRAGSDCGHPTIHSLSSPAQTLGYVARQSVSLPNPLLWQLLPEVSLPGQMQKQPVSCACGKAMPLIGSQLIRRMLCFPLCPAGWVWKACRCSFCPSLLPLELARAYQRMIIWQQPLQQGHFFTGLLCSRPQLIDNLLGTCFTHTSHVLPQA